MTVAEHLAQLFHAALSSRSDSATWNWDELSDEHRAWKVGAAQDVIDELGLRQEIRTNAMSSAGMTVNTRTGETTHHSDIRHDYRYVTNWKTHMPPGVIS